MAENSKIEWTDTTWNPVTGCPPVSPGCNGTIKLHEDKLLLPLRWRKPRRIFVNSMSDLFHESVPFEFVDRVFAVTALCPKHTFQILTKRPERMAEYLNKDPYPHTSRIGAIQYHLDVHYARTTPKEMFGRSGTRTVLAVRWPLPNVWLGTSVENQAAADERIPHLLRCPAAVRFLSCEPLLGNIKFAKVPGFNLCGQSGLDLLKNLWIIAGGESGPNARPLHPDWARTLRDQCANAGVPFFFKQGSQTPEWPRFKDFDSFPEDLRIREFPKVQPKQDVDDALNRQVQQDAADTIRRARSDRPSRSWSDCSRVQPARAGRRERGGRAHDGHPVRFRDRFRHCDGGRQGRPMSDTQNPHNPQDPTPGPGVGDLMDLQGRLRSRDPHPTMDARLESLEKDKGYLLSALADARAKESEWRAFYAASEFRCDRATKELATLRLWLKANAPDLLAAFDSEGE